MKTSKIATSRASSPAALSPKRVKLTAAELETKRKREAEILAELSGTHGYTFLDMPKAKDRFSFMMDRAAGTVVTMRRMQLAVPQDSALCKAMDKLVKSKIAAESRGIVADDKRRGKRGSR